MSETLVWIDSSNRPIWKHISDVHLILFDFLIFRHDYEYTPIVAKDETDSPFVSSVVPVIFWWLVVVGETRRLGVTGTRVIFGDDHSTPCWTEFRWRRWAWIAITPIQITNFGRHMFRSLTGAMLWLLASLIVAAELPHNFLNRRAFLLSMPCSPSLPL